MQDGQLEATTIHTNMAVAFQVPRLAASLSPSAVEASIKAAFVNLGYERPTREQEDAISYFLGGGRVFFTTNRRRQEPHLRLSSPRISLHASLDRSVSISQAHGRQTVVLPFKITPVIVCHCWPKLPPSLVYNPAVAASKILARLRSKVKKHVR